MTNTLNTNTLNTVTGFNGTSGQYLVSNGGAGYSFTDSILSVNNNPSGLSVKGTVTINGRDLEQRLETIEKVLGIPERDTELEEKYPKLKKMYDDYINELSKYRTWDALKE